ncbi:MAG TPA: hypothetical protein VF214_00965 [Edaphobacter sp.]
MSKRIPGAIWGAAVLAGLAGLAQMHKVSKPEQVVRAVGVYEWTGDLTKPKAMRFVPVSIFINGELADAGVYVARPVPFALETGNIYELDDSGQPKGNLELQYARHTQATDSEGDRLFEDGWLGYGKFHAPAPPATASKLKASKTLPVLVTSGGSSDKGDSGAKQDSSAGKDSPKPGSDDSDRPTMKRHPDTTTDSDSTASTGGSSGGSSSDNDVDRPTLKRRSPEEMKKAQKQKDQAAVLGTGTSLNDDPDRPKLKHNTEAEEKGIAELRGIPADMHQMVAVSDAKDRSPHAFTRPWTDDAERAQVLAKMQAFARAQLAAYKTPPTPAVSIASSGATSSGPAATPTTQSVSSAMAKAEEDPGAPTLKRGVPQQAKAAAQPASSQTATKTSTSAAPSKATTGTKRVAKSSAPAQASLLDEDLRGYVLSYGGAPTFVYTAHTDGTGSALRYVTVVAQDNGVSTDGQGGLGELKLALASVTDEGHLDRTPRMRLIDVVDAEASNRASLLFELRATRSRQFALYRVIAAKPEQIFVTGSTE